MKIIVNNEEEKKLLLKFIYAMHDFGFDAIEEADNNFLKDCSDEDPALWYHELKAISDGLIYTKIIVDSSVPEIYYDNDDLVVGTCCRCGTETEGTPDGETSYSDYLRLMSEESQKKWLCNSCVNAGYTEEDL